MAQRRPCGFIHARVYDPSARRGRGDYRWASLHHRDEERAKLYAAEQHHKLLKGDADLHAGRVTLGQVFSLYLRHRTPRKTPSEQHEDARRVELWTAVLGGAKDPYRITLGEWEAYIAGRRSGAIDAYGRPVPAGSRRSVRARRVEQELKWLRYVLGWATRWRDSEGCYLLRENPVRGYEIPTEKNPRRPVATADRYQALRRVSDHIPMRRSSGGRRPLTRSYLTELLDLAAGTGRRLSAICSLRYEDLRLTEGPYGVIRWPAQTDKTGRETLVPIGPEVRSALERVLRERPGIGAAFLFPSPGDPARPVSRQRADRWLRDAEKLAGLVPQDGSLWHAFRRKWATERKHLPDVDVAAAGGWKGTFSLKLAYQQADPETMLRVVLGAGELREARR